MNLRCFACLYLMKTDDKYTEKIEDLSGLSKEKPYLAFSFLILFFSLAGIPPPIGGFFAKFFIFMSVIESELYALAIIGLLTTVISAFYYLKDNKKIIYFDDNKIKFDDVRNKSVKATIFL